MNPVVVPSHFDFPPAREVEPCVWAGTFAADAVLYADPAAKVRLASIQFVEVESLELSRRAGDPTKVHLSWPMHSEAWIAAGSFPFALLERLEIVKGVYELARGARVQAWTGRQPGFASVSRPYSKAFTNPAFGERGLAEQVPCSKLNLPSEGLFAPTASVNQVLVVPDVEHWLTLTPGTELYSQPGKSPQGRVASLGVARVEQRGSWVNVRSFDSYGMPTQGGVDFRGWVPESATSPGLPLARAFGPIWLPPTHAARRRLALRRSPDAQAPIVGETAKGVPFRALKSERSFIQIHLPGLKEPALWIAEADLCDSERLH